MDPFFQAQIYQCPYFPSPPPRLTPYQATPIMTNPGLSTSNFLSTPMVPTYSDNLYSQTKNNAESTVTKVENIVETPMKDNVDIQNAQRGFGLVKDNNEEKEETSNKSDINTDSLKKWTKAFCKLLKVQLLKLQALILNQKSEKQV